MGYIKAEEILPMEIIELIQQYVDGQNIYIPRKAQQRKEWGAGTEIKRELAMRNQHIFDDYEKGLSVHQIAGKYFLSEKSIQRIVREMRTA